jgi:pheromone shutdown-related protein TraB
MGINTIKVVGTGHIFEKSVREVAAAIVEEKPQIVAVELDVARFTALEEGGWRLDAPERDVSIVSLLKAAGGGGSFPVLLQGFLALIQKELGKEFGIKPGSDMVAAIQSARVAGCRVALIDRDIDITLNHLLSIPFKEKLRLFSRGNEDLGAMGSVLGANAESLLEEKNIDLVMKTLKADLPTLYSALVDERDRYMAAALLALAEKYPGAKIVAVVGAGHRAGLEAYLRNPATVNSSGLTDRRRVSVFGVLILLMPVIAMYIFMKIKFRIRK